MKCRLHLTIFNTNLRHLIIDALTNGLDICRATGNLEIQIFFFIEIHYIIFTLLSQSNRPAYVYKVLSLCTLLFGTDSVLVLFSFLLSSIKLICLIVLCCFYFRSLSFYFWRRTASFSIVLIFCFPRLNVFWSSALLSPFIKKFVASVTSQCAIWKNSRNV